MKKILFGLLTLSSIAVSPLSAVKCKRCEQEALQGSQFCVQCTPRTPKDSDTKIINTLALKTCHKRKFSKDCDAKRRLSYEDDRTIENSPSTPRHSCTMPDSKGPKKGCRSRNFRDALPKGDLSNVSTPLQLDEEGN